MVTQLIHVHVNVARIKHNLTSLPLPPPTHTNIHVLSRYLHPPLPPSLSRYKKMVSEGKPHYSIVGYTTVYAFYAYPDKTRARISQMLVLPLYQRKGHGGVYTYCTSIVLSIVIVLILYHLETTYMYTSLIPGPCVHTCTCIHTFECGRA